MTSDPNSGLVQAGGGDDTALSTETAPDAGQTMRIDMLAGDEEGMPIEAPPRQGIPAYMIMLGVVVAVGGLALFGMRKLGVGTAIADEGTEIAYNLTDNIGDITADHEKAIAGLNTDQTDRQVPIEFVREGAVELDWVEKPAETTTITKRPTNTMTEEERAELERQKKIQAALKTLQVQAVVGGSNPVARVSGRLYRVGDRLEGVFEITEIRDRDVYMRGDDGENYVLQMKTASQSFGQ